MAESAFRDPTRQEVEESADLSRARRILAAYYVALPIGLIYLLFKIFPLNPWPTSPGDIFHRKVNHA